MPDLVPIRQALVYDLLEQANTDEKEALLEQLVTASLALQRYFFGITRNDLTASCECAAGLVSLGMLLSDERDIKRCFRRAWTRIHRATRADESARKALLLALRAPPGEPWRYQELLEAISIRH